MGLSCKFSLNPIHWYFQTTIIFKWKFGAQVEVDLFDAGFRIPQILFFSRKVIRCLCALAQHVPRQWTMVGWKHAIFGVVNAIVFLTN